MDDRDLKRNYTEESLVVFTKLIFNQGITFASKLLWLKAVEDEPQCYLLISMYRYARTLIPFNSLSAPFLEELQTQLLYTNEPST